MISVIVPAYNAQDTLDKCLEALQNQSIASDQYEILVVNDGSTDRTPEIASRRGVRLIEQPNAGPAAARNAGANAASGEILVFTDADCEPAPDWIAQIASPFSDPDLAGAKGAYRTSQRSWVARFVQLEYEDKYGRMMRSMRRHGTIDFIDTYSAAYRQDIFLSNGGFDPTFRTASVEDQELSFRLAQKGYKMLFVPEAIVSHQHDQSVIEYWRRKFRIGYWKSLLLRGHPDRIGYDSHTPQVLKAQIVLLGLLSLAIALSPFYPLARWSALFLCGSFIFSAAPFIGWAAGRDPVVALVAPWLLCVRACALGMGLLVGWTRFQGDRGHRDRSIRGLDRLIKRSTDIVGSAIGLIASIPVLIVLAAAIKLDSPGPVLFIQERIGKDGRPFRMLKLRTMVDGAEDMLPEPTDLKALPQLKQDDDPRVTRLGRFLRRSSVDELPQLWNVLRGEMSLVGPRPEEARIVRLYSDWHRRRLAVKPGITGPMQVSGRADLGLDERTRLELEYIEHYSWWRDMCILMRTVGALISRRGAY
jgi:lipopolysaccharide/colanic/teichoic acid biosynthesis glycosyltransferase/glycosyltransferase involved in cell wall biosynthesis